MIFYKKNHYQSRVFRVFMIWVYNYYSFIRIKEFEVILINYLKRVVIYSFMSNFENSTFWQFIHRVYYIFMQNLFLTTPIYFKRTLQITNYNKLYKLYMKNII